MKIINDRHFFAEVVRLDGNSFLNCSFQDCAFQYGGESCEWESCRFSNCRVVLDGAANNTVQVLKALGIDVVGPGEPHSGAGKSSGSSTVYSVKNGRLERPN